MYKISKEDPETQKRPTWKCSQRESGNRNLCKVCLTNKR